jgi:hypothetical protein
VAAPIRGPPPRADTLVAVATWEDVRELALALPEVEESTSYRQPCFKVRGKAFAGVSRHDGAIWARCDREERPLLVETNPDAYRLTPHFERSPAYLLIWLEHIDVSELRERLLDAWLIQAPKRLAAALVGET